MFMEITDIPLITGTLILKRFHLKSLPEQHKKETLIKQEKKPQTHQSEIKNKYSGSSEYHLVNTGMEGARIYANTILDYRFLE